jgi:proteasome lid subunit RPN8/RPN11
MTYDAYFDSKAVKKAEKHFSQAAKTGSEAIGLLIGEAFEWQGKAYAVIEYYITADNASSAVIARFDEKAFSKLARQLNDKHDGKVIAGWCHSHPDYGCFMSSRDEATQRKYFNEDWNIALVIDPVRREKKAFKLTNGELKEASFAVVEKK